MSLDSILNSVDLLLIDISDNLNRLLTTLTIFIPVFVISFAILVVLLILIIIFTMVLQCKKYQRVESLRRRSVPSIESPQSSRTDYKRVSSPVEKLVVEAK
ncbi:unnamed protein product [Bursaphelenchus xylophilus]|uniref:(pine wood nematode) hypothetical protein n=1 Tax=Bursaphelenchus xylophilus TaxID=6326 RepID=A0A7I8XPE8_BURXY|nr:unnamed protein product [Bursaphelenchus xylophilus]CAG9126862.1 unnamed protein product [Bursaphelenchus xylophilus]